MTATEPRVEMTDGLFVKEHVLLGSREQAAHDHKGRPVGTLYVILEKTCHVTGKNQLSPSGHLTKSYPSQGLSKVPTACLKATVVH